MATTLPTLTPAQLQQNRGSTNLTLLVVFCVLDVVAVVLRLCARRATQQKIWWDDYCSIGTLVFMIPYVYLAVNVTNNGLGRHIQTVSAEQLIQVQKDTRASEFIYTSILGLAKYSILLYFWRIFHPRTTFRLAFCIMFVLIMLWTWGVIITAFAQCKPFDALWYPKKGTCINIAKFYNGVTIPNIITDAMLLFLPMPYIFSLNLHLGKKIGLALVFGLGSFVIVASAFRLAITLQYQNSLDFTYDFAPVSLWSSLEVEMAIICGCLPSIAPLIRISFNKVRGVPSEPHTSETTTTDTLSSPSAKKQVFGDGFNRLSEQHSFDRPKQVSEHLSGGDDIELAGIAR